jgi:hypothetical protein
MCAHFLQGHAHLIHVQWRIQDTKGTMTDPNLVEINHCPRGTTTTPNSGALVSRKALPFLFWFVALGAISLGLPASAQVAVNLTPADQTPGLSQPAAGIPAARLLASVTSDPATLPDDPDAVLAATADTPTESDSLAVDNSPSPQTPRAERAASIHMKYIPAGWSVRKPLPAHDKVLLGFKDLYSPLTLSGDVLSAGYSHLTDGQPNYGVNSAAFGKRLGAAVLRDSTEGIFTDAVFAPLLHEDPRYYVEGPQYGFFHRTLYAVTRPLVTRTDSGRSSVNGALLLGYASASALSYTYYPQINRNFKDTTATFGGAIGGAALGFFVSEFSADVLHKLHLGKLL